jgi:hypothetical protein
MGNFWKTVTIETETDAGREERLAHEDEKTSAQAILDRVHRGCSANIRMTSQSLGEADPAAQARLLKEYDAKGFKVKGYHPKTCELMFDGGLEEQKKIAKHHGFEVG